MEEIKTENALIARICHDLITPCNAINLGIEAYETSGDRKIFDCLKEGAFKANTILKFMRELFSSKDKAFTYSEGFISEIVSDFLKIYHIECLFSVQTKEIPYAVGNLALYDTAILKELMPFGGKVLYDVRDDSLTVTYSGNGILELDTKIPSELNYKNVLRFKLLEQLKTFNFSIDFTMSEGSGIIQERS